ncbi:MAG: hypothetical protein WBZ37_20585, partial [Mycobacterium sp.]
MSPEDNNLLQVGGSRTSPSCGEVDKFHLEHSGTVVSSQLIPDSIAISSNYQIPQPIPLVPLTRREPEKLGET